MTRKLSTINSTYQTILVDLVNYIGFSNVLVAKVCSTLPPRKKLLGQEIVEDLFVKCTSVCNFFDIRELKVESTANRRSSTISRLLFLKHFFVFYPPLRADIFHRPCESIMKFFFASAGSEIAEHVIGNRIWIIQIFLQSLPSANTLNF